jgi:hypothetical protein
VVAGSFQPKGCVVPIRRDYPISYPIPAKPFPEWRGAGPALLTWDDLDVVAGMLSEIAPGWSAELNHASADESTIVVIPEGANDLVGPAFVLHRSQGRVQLDQFRWDEYRKLGGFRSLDEALAALRTRLVPLVSGIATDSAE